MWRLGIILLALSAFFAFLHIATVTGLVTSFSNPAFSSNRNAKIVYDGEIFNTQQHHDSFRIDHAINARPTRTSLFSLPSDEDLFVGLFLDKKKEETNAGDPKDAKPLTTKIIPSSFDIDKGAGEPRLSLEPDEIVSLLMTALENPDVPVADAGLVAMWEFATDTTKFVFKNNRTGKSNACCIN